MHHHSSLLPPPVRLGPSLSTSLCVCPCVYLSRCPFGSVHLAVLLPVQICLYVYPIIQSDHPLTLFLSVSLPSLSLCLSMSLSLSFSFSLSFSVSLSPLSLLSLPLSASLLVLSPTSTSVFQSLCSSVSLLSVSSSLYVCLVWLCICSSVYLFACLFICVAVCKVRLGTILTIFTIFLYLFIRQVDFFHRIPTPSMWIYYLLYLLYSG